MSFYRDKGITREESREKNNLEPGKEHSPKDSGFQEYLSGSKTGLTEDRRPLTSAPPSFAPSPPPRGGSEGGDSILKYAVQSTTRDSGIFLQ